jgi:predicted deacylase
MARNCKAKGMTHGLLTWIMFLFWMLSAKGATGQKQSLPLIDSLDFASISPGSYMESWLKMGEDAQGNPIKIPIIIAKGDLPGPVVGIAAAIHGNELNGIAVVQQIFARLDLKNVYGTIIGIPGLNPLSIEQHERRFPDQEDLNRGFPGKLNGSTSQQFIYQIDQKILPKLDI